jgi:hypothetical protein
MVLTEHDDLIDQWLPEDKAELSVTLSTDNRGSVYAGMDNELS